MAPEEERYRPYAAVYLLSFDDEQVLLLKRKNTGHRDGEYSLVAGHIDEDEAATEAMVREAYEEVGITIERSDLEAVHVIHRDSGAREYLDIFFVADHWQGEIENREPEKCAELAWVDSTALPENTVPYVKQAIANISGGVFSEFGW